MKNKIFWSFVFSVLGLLIGYFILYSDLQPTAAGDFFVRLGKSLVYGTGALSIVFLILFFVPRAFEIWKKFAIWFIPLAALLFIFYPDPGSGDLFAPYPEQIFQWVSGLYVIASVAIIAWVLARSR